MSIGVALRIIFNAIHERVIVMAKCEVDGCYNEALSGARLCARHRDEQNETKDTWLKVALGGAFCFVTAAVGFFAARRDD